jgi:hypothetical protein
MPKTSSVVAIITTERKTLARGGQLLCRHGRTAARWR